MRLFNIVFFSCLAFAALHAAQWGDLARHQGKLTRAQFVEKLETRYAPNGAASAWVEIEDSHALIRTGEKPDSDIFYRLKFAGEIPATDEAEISPCTPPPEADPALPLKGLRVALEAGHVGDQYAQLESRLFQIAAEPPVREGDLTLQVVRLAAEKLRALGAEVILVRDDATPLTLSRGKDFASQEIRARAEKINTEIRPDILLSIHFDALPWQDPAHPELMDGPSKAHAIIGGGYSSSELSKEEPRILMLEKLLGGDGDKELALARQIGSAIEKRTGLLPARYTSASAVAFENSPYLWARNLMVTRLYRAPTVLCELYVMNRPLDYARIQAGRYEGTREFRGKPYPNIFEEYAQTLTDALLAYHAPDWQPPVALEQKTPETNITQNTSEAPAVFTKPTRP